MADITLVSQHLETEVEEISTEVTVLTVEQPTVEVDVTSPTTTVIDVVPDIVIDVTVAEQVVDVTVTSTVIEVATYPLVIPATAGEPVAKDMQIDEASGTVTYVGTADPGTATSQPLWSIKRITEAGSQTTVDWASGSPDAVHVWDDRASLTYGP